MKAVRSFVRWLWEQDAIESLPKNVDSHSLRITVDTTEPKRFTIPEIKTLLENASDRTRLYILLGLNCGMTQREISDIQQDNLDWKAGTLTRKRSKTSRYENVPTVTYRLWPETLKLLKQHQSGSETVLLNGNGQPLVNDQIDSSGKYRRNDNVKNAFDRLLRKVKLKKPFKLMRKTSSSLLHNKHEFHHLAQLFLGQSPRTVAEKSYLSTDKDSLDLALEFLRTEFTPRALKGKPSNGLRSSKFEAKRRDEDLNHSESR